VFGIGERELALMGWAVGGRIYWRASQTKNRLLRERVVKAVVRASQLRLKLAVEALRAERMVDVSSWVEWDVLRYIDRGCSY
jgi:hypothetical protein